MRHAHVAACMPRFGMLHFARVGYGGDSAGAFRTRWTALRQAAYTGKVEVVKVLLAVKGIEVNAKDNDGCGWFGYFLPFCYQVGEMRHAIFGYGCLGGFFFLEHAIRNMQHATCNTSRWLFFTFY